MVSKGLTRIDIAELKALIYQKIGAKRAEMYFNLLNRYLNSKISRSDFSKLCSRTVGREHLSLHNRLIRSIVDNASLSKVPPPKVVKASDPLNIKITKGYRKKRSPVSRDRKFRDWPSPLGPLGKTRSPALDQSPTEPNSHGSRPRVAIVEEGEEVEQVTVGSCVQSRSPIMAPLGVSLKFDGGSRKKCVFKETTSNFSMMTCESSRELPDSVSLRSRLEHRLLSDGVGISADCVNLVNNSLDVFLKRLIEPAMELARSRFSFCRNLPLRCVRRPAPSICMSMLDFRVSMESNPRILGVDWPVQLEKVSSHAYEE